MLRKGLKNDHCKNCWKFRYISQKYNFIVENSFFYLKYAACISSSLKGKTIPYHRNYHTFYISVVIETFSLIAHVVSGIRLVLFNIDYNILPEDVIKLGFPFLKYNRHETQCFKTRSITVMHSHPLPDDVLETRSPFTQITFTLEGSVNNACLSKLIKCLDLLIFLKYIL